MEGSFASAVSAFGSVQDGQLTFIRGGHNKEGLVRIDMGAATTVTLVSSGDNGATWPVIVATYTTDTIEHVKLPDPNIIYTLDCTIFGAATPYTFRAT